GDQGLGDEPATVWPEVPGDVRHQAGGGEAHRAGLGVAGWLPAVTSSATASRGLFCVTRPSPTSTASAPADAYLIRSCGPRTPDSAILTTWLGRPGAIRSKTVRSTSRVRRLRAF